MVQTDEALVSYDAIIKNMHLGRTWLYEEFGVNPTIGWQLDAFGHTETNAELFRQMGIDILVFARMSLDLKDYKK